MYTSILGIAYVKKKNTKFNLYISNNQYLRSFLVNYIN